MNFQENFPHIIVTFPRCGSHYLQDLFHQKTGFEMSRDHKSFNKEYLTFDSTDQFIVSIIRNPRETFRSMYAMDLHYGIDANVDHGLPNDYCNFYGWIIENADVLIDYNDLINKPDKVVKALADILKLNVNGKEYISRVIDKPEMNHLVSSKTSKEYENVDLSSLNFQESDAIYMSALKKCIAV
jgi:hypothetical protein